MDFLPAVAVGERPGRLGEEQQGDQENSAGGSLHAPCNTEGGGTVDGHGATVGNKVHDQNSPFDRPLLDTDNATADATRSELSEVDTALRASNTNGKTRNDAAADKVADILGRGLESGSDKPDNGRDLQSTFPAEEIGNVTSGDGTDEGTAGHGRGDTA